MKTPILSVMLNVNDELHDALAPALGDIAEAARVTGRISLQKASDLMAKFARPKGEGTAAPGPASDETDVEEITVVESELGEPPVKKPKAAQ